MLMSRDAIVSAKSREGPVAVARPHARARRDRRPRPFARVTTVVRENRADAGNVTAKRASISQGTARSSSHCESGYSRTIDIRPAGESDSLGDSQPDPREPRPPRTVRASVDLPQLPWAVDQREWSVVERLEQACD
jgi:hypothetical protein